MAYTKANVWRCYDDEKVTFCSEPSQDEGSDCEYIAIYSRQPHQLDAVFPDGTATVVVCISSLSLTHSSPPSRD